MAGIGARAGFLVSDVEVGRRVGEGGGLGVDGRTAKGMCREEGGTRGKEIVEKMKRSTGRESWV